MQRQIGTIWQQHIKPWLQAFSFVAVGVGVISSFMNLYSAKQPAEIDVTSFNNATLQILYYLTTSSQGSQQNCSLCAIMDQVHSMQLALPSVPAPKVNQGMSPTAVTLQRVTNYLSPIALILGIFAFAVDCHIDRKMRREKLKQIDMMVNSMMATHSTAAERSDTQVEEGKALRSGPGFKQDGG